MFSTPKWFIYSFFTSAFRSCDRLCMKMQCFKCMPLTRLCCFGNWTALKFWQNGAVCCDLCGNFLILIGRWCWCCKTVKGFLLLLLDSWCSPQQQRWTLTNNQDGSSFLHSCHLRRFHHLCNFCRFSTVTVLGISPTQVHSTFCFKAQKAI